MVTVGVSIFLQVQLFMLASCLVIPLPGGRKISYNSDTGVLRIQLNPPIIKSPTATTFLDQQALQQAIEVRHTGNKKGYGAFAVKPLEDGAFLGFYEGELVQSRETLDEIVQRRRTHLEGDGGAMDYVMSLDGGMTFLDGYERAKDRSTFTPAHLNHADKNTFACNCIRILEEGRVTFLTSRHISIGEELCFNYGSNFWSGREELKL